MPTLTAWCYQTPLGAKVGEVRLRRLQEMGALEVHCAVIVTWVRGAHRPRTSHVRHWARTDRDDPGLLGALARAILHAATAEAPSVSARALARRLQGTGIDSRFLVDVGQHFAPGRSVLLVLSGRADLDVVRPVVQLGLAAGGVALVRAEVPGAALGRLAAAVGLPEDDGPGHPKRGRPHPEPPP